MFYENFLLAAVEAWIQQHRGAADRIAKVRGELVRLRDRPGL